VHLHEYELVLGLPHTNHNGLAEHLLMMHAGHLQWTSIARAIGRPLSALRTATGGEVYATFYFIEERFPDTAPIDSFGLDDRLLFRVFLRAYKGIAVEGRLLFDRADRLPSPTGGAPGGPSDHDTRHHPYIRFANIFITPEAGNSRLRVAAPANADFSALPVLPNDENPYHLTRAAEGDGLLGVLDAAWGCVDRRPGFQAVHAIDIDRDTNGAGLVYFANYFAFMDAAERMAMAENSTRAFGVDQIAGRVVHHRRVAYYGNVSPTDRVSTRVSLFTRRHDDRSLGVRYATRRDQDGRLICVSEAVKVLPAP
jgi:probable biosynthetic protein (TIGR04098 family)